MLKKLLSTVLGVIVMLAWWTIHGSHTKPEEVLQSIPPKVWDGGGGTLSIELDTNVAGKLSLSFDEEGDKGRHVTAIESAGPGTHSWSVQVPRDAGGYVEFGADAPQPGAKLSWTLRHDGRRIATETETLDRPLQNNEALFLQQYFDDYGRPDASGEDDVADDD
jgi:hypothetical protein